MVLPVQRQARDASPDQATLLGGVMDIVIGISALLAGLAIGVVLGLWRGSGAKLALAGTQARLDETQATLMGVVHERDAARTEAAALRASLGESETQIRLARQETETMARRIADWEETRSKFLETTRASVLTTAQELSSKLLEDHKREAAAAKAEAEQQIQATTEDLKTQMGQLTEGVAQLKGQVGEKAAVLDTVWRALTNPAGAGYYAEIGLANTLRSFGLQEGRDFLLQPSVQGEEPGRRLRPDAIVFLPGDSALVVDSKASKHLLDLARAEGEEQERQARDQLKARMNQHLKDLAGKDYVNAVEQSWRIGGRAGKPVRTLSVMYLPNDAALEKLLEADPDFSRKAADAQIIPAGPAGLSSFIGFASVEIRLMQQIENQERIVQGMERLLESVAVAVGHAAGVGKGIRSAADAFAKLTGTVNGRLLPRARDLQKLGLRPPKPIPGNLGAYQVFDRDGDALIDGEAAEVPEDGRLIGGTE
jgi:DNA recombination protein RmuC